MKRILFLLTSCSLLLTPAIALAQSVDLLWQGATYVSPFYKGKALWSKQAQVTLLAIPHGVGDRNGVVYRWIRNGTVLGSMSGVGKNTLTLTDSILSRTQTVRMEIVAIDDYESPIIAQAFVTLTPTSPTLAVYENNPLYGFMFHKEVGGAYRLKDKEMTFTAFPFFYSVADREDTNLSYEWQSDGTKELKNSVTYRAPEEGSGSSKVSLRVSNTEKIMQSASESFLVQFGPVRD